MMLNSASILVRVQTIRKQNPYGFGGCIFTGVPIDETGQVLDATEYYVISASSKHLADVRVDVGQWWQVSGEFRSNQIIIGNGRILTEKQFDEGLESLDMCKLSGEHIVTLLANGNFKGIGRTKAQRLWDRFGEDLYGILDGRDVGKLKEVLTQETAEHLAEAWQSQGDSKTLIWLAQNHFDAKLGRKLIKHFGAQTPEKIKEDPYRLLSFCAGWKETDDLARNQFGIAKDDPRRLQAAIEEATYRIFNNGHTCATFDMLVSYTEAILAVDSRITKWSKLIRETLKQGLTNGSYVIGDENTIHPAGPLAMEKSVAHAIAKRLLSIESNRLLGTATIDALIAEYEARQQAEKPGFALNQEQREAVHVAAANPFCIITGGAGAGKTTVLEMLYSIYDKAGIKLHQAALAGKAAKRMEDTTKRTANTIHTFLNTVTEDDLKGPTAVVLDETSMLDIWTLYRLATVLPDHVRLVMVGDPAQLMPVGPGLTLHALVKVAGIPLVELKKVNRYGGMIAKAAQAVREGEWLKLPSDSSSAIAFIPCEDIDLTETVANLYGSDPASSQILSATKGGTAGTSMVNLKATEKNSDKQPEVITWAKNDEIDMLCRTGLRLNHRIICTKNIYERGLRNGSLGTITKIEPNPQPPTVDDEGNRVDKPIAWVTWDDGELRPLFETMLDHIELAYSITIHKSQGSQWPRVIIPIPKARRTRDGRIKLGRLLDRTLIYTAMTRAQVQVLFVGDLETVKAAVAAPPKAASRRVALDRILQTFLLEGE